MAIHNFLKVCSVLPAMLVMPAMAADDVKTLDGDLTVGGIVNYNGGDYNGSVVSGDSGIAKWNLNGHTLHVNSVHPQSSDNSGEKTGQFAISGNDLSFTGRGTLKVTTTADNPEKQRGIFGAGVIDVDNLIVDTTASQTPKGAIYSYVNNVEGSKYNTNGNTGFDITAKNVDIKANGGLAANTNSKINMVTDDLAMDIGAEAFKTDKNAAVNVTVNNSALIKAGQKETLDSDELPTLLQANKGNGVVTLTVNGKAIVEGDIYVGKDGVKDDTAKLKLTTADSFFNGAVVTHADAKSSTVDLGAATWDVAADSNLTDLLVNGGAVKFNGNKVASNNVTATDATFSGGQLTVNTSMTGSGVVFSDSEFTGNGGALNNLGTTTLTGDTVFNANSATGNGGAIYNTGTLNITGNENNLIEFTGNKATAGGVLYTTAGDVTIDNVNFEGNTATHGGVVIVGGSNKSFSISNSEFKGNSAEAYGAMGIFGSASLTDMNFINNRATAASVRDGSGAVFLGASSATALNSVISGVVFDGNTSASHGGAIGMRAYADGDDSGAKLDIAGTTFKNNDAAKNGGAINNFFYGSNANADAVYVTDSKFSENTAILGGAVYNHGISSMQLPNADKNEYQAGAIQFNNVTFDGNVAKTTGAAIYNEFGATVMLSGDNVFSDNMIARSYDRYGATVATANDIHNLGTVKITGGKTTIGGGVTGSGVFNIDSGAELILSANNADTTVNLDNSVVNDGDVTISSGVATIAGGMGIGGTGTLTVADGATLNIGTAAISQDALVLNGTMNVDVMKNGRGTDGVRYRSRDAISSDIASAADRNLTFGKLRMNAITFGDAGILNLNIGSAGTYEMFGNVLPDDATNYTADKVKFGETYNVSYAYKTDDGNTPVVVNGDKIGMLIVETKDVEQIATDVGINTDTAQVVSYLANSDSADLAALSLRTQQELNAGNTEYVETELSKMNPDNKPIAQSVATSAQNEILSLVSSRVSGGGMIGRNGGDAGNAEYGMWAHGLFNKSKMNGQFHGYTRGVAIGVDGLINDVYTLGIGAAFNNTDVHANNARDTNIDSNSVFVYGQYKPTKWYINGALTYTNSEYDETVTPMGTIFHNQYDVNAYGASIMTGYDFATGFTPEVGARYLHIESDSYTDGSGRKVAGDNTNYMTGVAGMKYSFALDTASQWNWRPELRAAATYDFVSDEIMATISNPGAAAYIIDANRLNRVGGEFGVGMNMTYRGLDIVLKYDIALRQDYTSQTGTVKFRLDF